MVWCAVTREKVICPDFFEDGNVDGEKYRNMLINYAFPSFTTLRQDYNFQQNVLQHTIQVVREIIWTIKGQTIG